MKGFLKWLVIAVAVVAGVFVLGGFLIPQQWKVTRDIAISAPAEDIYAQVANLRNWQNWAPWNMEKDPSQVYTYEGPELGVGAKWLWTSEKMGNGFLEIKKAEPKDGIEYDLFIEFNDMKSNMVGMMNFKENDGVTNVTWTDIGDSGNNMVKRWMSLLVVKMLGDEMDDGLKKLKALVESKPKGDTKANDDSDADAEDADEVADVAAQDA